MLPPVFKLISEIALVEHPIFHELVIQDITDHVGCVDAQVSDDMVAEKDIVDQRREDVLALIGNPARLGDGEGLRHDPIELPAVRADVIERLTILVFRVSV